MDISSNEKLKKICDDYNQLSLLLTYEEVIVDKKLYLKLNSDKLKLQPVVEKYNRYQECLKKLTDLEEFLKEEKSDKSIFKNELEKLNKDLSNYEKETINALNLIDAIYENIIVEIVNNTKDNLILYSDLIESFEKFCKNNMYSITTLKESNCIKLMISGFNAKKTFESVIGIHKMLDNKSQCMVFVYDQYDKKEFTFNEDDIKIESCRSSGAGGQHINRTDSAIKITHLATNITATCQNERSQYQNKQTALNNLIQKVNKFYNDNKNDYYKNLKNQILKNFSKNQITALYDYEKRCVTKGEIIFSLDDMLSGKII